MKNAIVVNFHGGFPAAYIPALKNLASVQLLLDAGYVIYDRVYPTTSSAPGSFHDAIIDAPTGTLTDAVWHTWSKTDLGVHRTIFHLLKDAGFETHMLGAYGLDGRFDPHRNMRDHPYHLESALQPQGVDVFDVDDAAFTCRVASAADRDVLQRLYGRMLEWESTPNKHAAIVNMLGANDVHKLSWIESPFLSHQSLVPSLSPSTWQVGIDAQSVGANSIAQSARQHDPRKGDDAMTDFPPRVREALRRSTMLHDRLRGEAHEAPADEKLVKMVNAFQSYAWKSIVLLDELLSQIVQKALENETEVIMACDHPLSLYEHGVVCEHPFESCCRGFLIAPQTTKIPDPSTPMSFPALFRSALCETLHVPPPTQLWHARPMNSPLTLCFAPSNLCRASVVPRTDPYELAVFWLRFVMPKDGRIFAASYYLSVADLVMSTLPPRRCADEWTHGTLTQRSAIVYQLRKWRLQECIAERVPDLVFEIVGDPCELNNIAVGDWFDTDLCAGIRRFVADAIDAHGLSELSLAFPKNAHSLDAAFTSLCSVQVRGQAPLGQPTGEDAQTPLTVERGVQTEAAVHFSRPLQSSIAAAPLPPVTQMVSDRLAVQQDVAAAPPPALVRARTTKAANQLLQRRMDRERFR